MSALIAYVQFKTGKRQYPVNLYRSDIKDEDIVLVYMPRQATIKEAVVRRREMRGWNCVNSIIGKPEDVVLNSDATFAIAEVAKENRITEQEDLIKWLRQAQWKGAPTYSSQFNYAFWWTRPDCTAYIALKRRGLEFFLNLSPEPPTLEGGKVRLSATPGRRAYHWYNLAAMNINDFAIDFASSVVNLPPEESEVIKKLSDFFSTQGQKPNALMYRGSQEERENRDIYWATSGGGGGPGYLGDGMWIDSDGVIFDD